MSGRIRLRMPDTCPVCHQHGKVLSTRRRPVVGVIWRRHECIHPHELIRWTSYQHLMAPGQTSPKDINSLASSDS